MKRILVRLWVIDNVILKHIWKVTSIIKQDVFLSIFIFNSIIYNFIDMLESSDIFVSTTLDFVYTFWSRFFLTISLQFFENFQIFSRLSLASPTKFYQVEEKPVICNFSVYQQ